MPFKALRGNKYIELLSTSNKMLIDQWKMHNGVQKEYDSQSKTYIYNVGGKSPVAQMSLPKDKKQKLDLYYPLLVLQLCFPTKASILFDIGITSCNSQRKRITLSSNQKSKQNASLFTALPFAIENFNCWVHVLVDVEEIVAAMWDGIKFKGIDFLSLSGVFRLKRIFLVSRDLIHLTEGTYIINYDELPKHLLLPKNMSQYFKYISSSHNSLEYLKETSSESKSSCDTKSSRTSSRSSLGSERFCTPETKTMTVLEKYKKTPIVQFLNKQEISQSHINENFEMDFDLNLSALTFSDNYGNQNEFHFGNIPIKVNEKCSSEDNALDRSCTTGSGEGSVELWMPY